MKRLELALDYKYTLWNILNVLIVFVIVLNLLKQEKNYKLKDKNFKKISIWPGMEGFGTSGKGM